MSSDLEITRDGWGDDDGAVLGEWRGIGSIISRSLRIYVSNFVPFTALMLIVLSPLLAYNLLLDLAILPGPGPLMSLPVSLLQIMLTNLASAALTFGVIQSIRGQRTGLGDCLRTGLERLLPVLGVGILTTIIVGFGMVLLVVPGLIAIAMLFVSVPATVVEDTGVMDALTRSAQLTEGYRWSMFGIALVLGLITWLVLIVLGLALPIQEGEPFSNVSTTLLDIPMGCLQAVAVSVTYLDLKSVKEGADADVLAQVFR